MVYLTVTPALVRAVRLLQLRNQVQEIKEVASEPPLDDLVIGSPISHLQVILVSKKLKGHADIHFKEGLEEAFPCRLDDLLRGSNIYIEPPKPRAEPTSQHKALMARLRREEESRAYERMINPPLPLETFHQRFPHSSQATLFPAAQADIGEDNEISYADINRQMALIINILISIVACSVAIWMAARHWSTPSRLGMSLGGSGMIGVAEVGVYAGYLRRLKDAREKGKKEVEIKEIIKTWVIGSNGKEASDDSEIITSRSRNTESVLRKRVAPK